MALEHNFYLINLEDKTLIENKNLYSYLILIDSKEMDNGYDGVNIIDKVNIHDDFINIISNFLIFIPNSTPESVQLKSNFGLNYYGITVLKNSKVLYNIFDGLYKIFNQFENEFYIQEIYSSGFCIEQKLITKEKYINLNNKKSCKKLYKEDILYIFKKLKEFSLKIKEENFYILHLGI